MTLASHNIFIVITIHYAVSAQHNYTGNQGKWCVLNFENLVYIILLSFTAKLSYSYLQLIYKIGNSADVGTPASYIEKLLQAYIF